MVKKAQKPLQIVVRRGSKVDFDFDVSEYGTDSDGTRFAVLNVTGKSDLTMYVKDITDDQVHLTAVRPESTPEDIAKRADKLAKAIEDKKAAEHDNTPPDWVAAPVKPAKKESKPVEPIAVHVTLTVDLDDEERTIAAKNAALIAAKAAAAKQAAKERAAADKANIKALEAEATALTNEHNTGKGDRLVHCFQHFDLQKETTWYEYRGKRYELRPMNDHERREMLNRNLFGEPPALPTTKIDPKKSKARKGDDIAKDAAAHDEQVGQQKLEEQRKRDEAAKEFREKKRAEKKSKTKDDEIAEVMNSEKSRNGKKDHVSV